MKVYVISEDNHGQIGIAASRKAALQWLVATNWVGKYSCIWCPKEIECYDGPDMTLNYLFGENWNEGFLWLSDELLENMGFYIHEEELIEEED